MKIRPSELVAIRDDDIAAYCFDRAVNHFGSSLKSELDSVEGKTDADIQRKRMQILDKWIPEAASTKQQMFRDPAKG